MAITVEISNALKTGKVKDVKTLVEKALAEGIDAKVILQDGLLAGMDVIGEQFKNNDIFIPEVLMAARAMNAGTEVLKPKLAAAGTEPIGKAVIGTVKGDLHDIGKNLVKMMMEGKGIEVFDLGADVPAEDFVAKAKEVKADIIACSAMLTTTMSEMKRTVELATKEGIRDGLCIMVGGSPITPAFCKSIGADIYEQDAASAADAAKAWLSKK